MPTALDLTTAYPPVCLTGEYGGWRDMFYCITPFAWTYIGIALAMGLSIAGAAW